MLQVGTTRINHQDRKNEETKRGRYKRNKEKVDEDTKERFKGGHR
jgi:hypothetical protein